MRILFEDSPDYEMVLGDYLERIPISWSRDESFGLLKTRLVAEPETTRDLAEKVMDNREKGGELAGSLLSAIAETSEGQDWMFESLTSGNVRKEASALVMLLNLISSITEPNLDHNLRLLKANAQSVSEDNTHLLLWCLEEACEKERDIFVPLLEEVLRTRGVPAASVYLSRPSLHRERPVSALVLAVEILEEKGLDNGEISLGLIGIYPKNREFVLERLKRWISKGKFPDSHHGMLVAHLKKHDTSPIIALIEELIDSGNRNALYVAANCLEELTQSISEWLGWCEKWESDSNKEPAVIRSLLEILSRLKTYEASGDRIRAIELVQKFASRSNIDYEDSTKHISLGKYSHEGCANTRQENRYTLKRP
ncbi:MAG: hypothetical protein E3J35_09245 [Methanomassiliicoccales archaeon]|nr:MAG: hypothetical protein E3J35_09245 [Methanomassiliicoccales archaeon]